MKKLCLVVTARDGKGGLPPLTAYMLTERRESPVEGERIQLVAGFSLTVNKLIPMGDEMAGVGFVAENFYDIVRLGQQGWRYRLDTAA